MMLLLVFVVVLSLRLDCNSAACHTVCIALRVHMAVSTNWGGVRFVRVLVVIRALVFYGPYQGSLIFGSSQIMPIRTTHGSPMLGSAMILGAHTLHLGTWTLRVGGLELDSSHTPPILEHPRPKISSTGPKPNQSTFLCASPGSVDCPAPLPPPPPPR